VAATDPDPRPTNPAPRGRAQARRKKGAGIAEALDGLLQDAVAGDPMTGLKWTHKSTRRLSAALRRLGFQACPNTVARLLRARAFSLRACRKQLAETGHRDRDRQYRYLVRMRRLYLARGWPVISVDTKKKEWVANFRNPGRCWRRRPRRVLAHDFPSWAEGPAIPYGIYDLARDDGYVVVGTSHDTPTFAVAAIRRWWLAVGRHRYPGAQRLLIEADSGGSNDSRKWEWKVALQALADETGLVITVTHFPTGASKWNPIDHRMFSLISGNWAGEPLTSYETVLKYIRATRSSEGFRCRASLDRRQYEARHRVLPEERARVRLQRRKVLPEWNYTIKPHTHRAKGSSYR
jgi:Rhodopirellula transposase DDE domain